jgi:hypothetical protein
MKEKSELSDAKQQCQQNRRDEGEFHGDGATFVR